MTTDDDNVHLLQVFARALADSLPKRPARARPTPPRDGAHTPGGRQDADTVPKEDYLH